MSASVATGVKRLAVLATGVALATVLVGTVSHGNRTILGATLHGGDGGPQPASCLDGPGNGNRHDGDQLQHVIYIQFDNVHFQRDRPNVPSDLEQMPHLLNFLRDNGTLLTNQHTPLISHTADDILTSLTGMYPDRSGMPVANSYDYFDAGGNPHYTSSFKYWTDAVSTTGDTLPNMVTDGQKNTPAPWVPFTRAGCDVGGVGTANIELENTSTAPTGDITTVFGQNSPEWNLAGSNPHEAQTDYVGIAIHCAQTATSKCANSAHARPDLLPDEPDGYTNYQALYGAAYVDPAITGGNACVNDTAGQPITDPDGTCGFPGFDGMLAKNTLGYVAQMQESGVPVTYAYISDAHDQHTPNTTTDSYQSSALGPGEPAYRAQLEAYDDAFAAFFDDLARHHIDKHNTLFVVTADEGDHFAGGAGDPSYTHTICTNLAACPADQIGEVDVNLNALLPAADQNTSGSTKYDIHFDDAPTFYVTGQPDRNTSTLRRFEQDVAGLTSLDPYARDAHGNVKTVPFAQAMVDTVGEKALHMINSDPARTPTFTMFGNPDFYFQLSNCSGVPECANPGFAWNHGDIQPEIVTTFAGFVGPGIAHHGIDRDTWSDHTNLRPTILSLAGLKDDYLHDGRVLVEVMTGDATPRELRDGQVRRLAEVYEQLNASVGDFGRSAIRASTKALESSDAHDGTYTSIENQLTSLTAQRDALALEIKTALDNAAFGGQRVSNADSLTRRAQELIDEAAALAH